MLRFLDSLEESGQRLIGLAAGAALLVTLLSLFGNLYWFLELFTHFRLQLAAGAAAMTILAVIFRMPNTAALFTVLAVVNLCFTLQYVTPGFRDVQASGPDGVRILSFNLHKRNTDHDALLRLVEETRPDIIGLMEYQDHWNTVLDRLEPSYPYQLRRPEDGVYGLALVSRFPLRELDESPYVEDGVPAAILANIEWAETPATLVLSHLVAPISPGRARARNTQLERLSAFFRDDSNQARILIGDLNITPWSPLYPLLESQTGLSNAARSRGYLGSWPVTPWFVRIPIDHCLVSDSFTVQHIGTGPDAGSDHLPLIVDLSLARPDVGEAAVEAGNSS